MRLKLIFIFIFTVSLLGMASADFKFSDVGSSMSAEYNIPSYAKAKINISFQNEPVNSSFKDSLGNSINISDLLKKIPDFQYTIDEDLKTITCNYNVIPFENARFTLPNSPGTFSYQLNLTKKDRPSPTEPYPTAQLFKKQIKMVSSSATIENEISRKNELLTDANKQILTFDSSTQKLLNDELNISGIKDKLNAIETQYEGASSSDYPKIMQNLSKINTPKIISEITSTNLINFYQKKETINTDVLQSIAGEGNYSEEKRNGYLDAIYLWNEDNLKTKLVFKQISIIYETGNETDLRIFKFQFDKTNMKDEAYFIIEDLGDINFYGNYSERGEEEYIYINLKDTSNEIIFSTKKEVNFIGVPVFISPSLEDLIPVEVGDYDDSGGAFSKWVLFGLIILLLLLIAVVSYIVIQGWYRRKYENYLFKNRNNLFNIMTYIQNSKRAGMKREEIIKNLKKSKWSREQVNYAMNKYEGNKIAGIIERPFKKVLESIDQHYPKKH